MKIRLFYLSDNTTGGWVTFTSHLFYGLEAALGEREVTLHKVRARTEERTRDYGYGLRYQNISLADALRLDGVPIITAAHKNYREQAAALLSAGSWVVVHDPTEFKTFSLGSLRRVFAIRKAVQEQLPGAALLPHPYLPGKTAKDRRTGNRKTACSVARIDFDKNTHVIMAANRLLPEDRRVEVYGFENRIYTKFKLMPQFPEWEQSKRSYPRERQAALNLLAEYQYGIDLSVIKGDGGGTQYTFLEAADAGAVNVIHQSWVRPDDEMNPGTNCWAVGSAEELAALLTDRGRGKYRGRLLQGGEELLQRHHAEAVGNELLGHL